jgi:hypothetical protein
MDSELGFVWTYLGIDGWWCEWWQKRWLESQRNGLEYQTSNIRTTQCES